MDDLLDGLLALWTDPVAEAPDARERFGAVYADPVTVNGTPMPLDALVERARGLWPFLDAAHAGRLVRAYGTRLDRVIAGARGWHDLGARFGSDLSASEVRYLMRHEWAETADDILWRRSKLGLRLTAEEQAALARFIEDERRPRAAAE